MAYPNDRWDARFDATEVQENFDPGVGFVTRRGYRRFSPELDFTPRPANHRYIRQIEFGGTLDVQTDLHDDLLARVMDFTLLQVNLHSQDNFSISTSRNFERLDEPFELSNDITLPLGAEYNFSRYRIWMQTANRRVLALMMRYDGGDLSTRLYRLNLETQFTPYIALVNNVQYDSRSAVLGWQSRFRWILTPGNDLYVVYAHNWLDAPTLNRLSTLDRRAASKMLYTYRF